MHWILSLLLLIALIPLLVSSQSSVDTEKLKGCYTDLFSALGKGLDSNEQSCEIFKSFFGCVLRNAFPKKPTPDELKILNEEIRKELSKQGKTLPCSYNMQEIADKVWNGALKTSSSFVICILGLSFYMLLYLNY